MQKATQNQGGNDQDQNTGGGNPNPNQGGANTENVTDVDFEEVK